MAWIRHNVEHLRRGREYAEALARAACKLYPNARVYVIGSIARGDATVASDIDVLIVIPGGHVEREGKPGIAAKIFEVAVEEHELPWDAPVELHIATPGEARSYLGREVAVAVLSCPVGTSGNQ